MSVIERLHREAIEAGRASYRDPRTGLSVMTSAYLSERGFCCDSGCRHCPWPQSLTTGEPKK